MGGFFYAYQDAEKVRQQGGGWPGESPVLAQRAVSEEQEGNSQTILLAPCARTMKWMRRGWRLMIFCARATRAGLSVWLAGLSGLSGSSG